MGRICCFHTALVKPARPLGLEHVTYSYCHPSPGATGSTRFNRGSCQGGESTTENDTAAAERFLVSLKGLISEVSTQARRIYITWIGYNLSFSAFVHHFLTMHAASLLGWQRSGGAVHSKIKGPAPNSNSFFPSGLQWSGLA